MTAVEKLIFGARLKGASISTVPEEELNKILNDIVIRLTAICGCPLPNTEYFANILAKEINDFLIKFKFEQYTLSEIILAFQLNSGGYLKHPTGENIESIKFTGAFLNIDYMAKVLNNYREVRNLLDRKLQNHIDGYEL
jgi:hypothetical protein